VFPTPEDWPTSVHNTGYWFLDEPGGWQPPKGLLDFLEGGPAPVYVGFGSVGDPQQAAATTRLVAAALQQAGQRGVLATGWQGMAQMDDLPEGIYMLESAPHSWLFPRMAAVVHHGGAGTTAAGLRAGVPSVVVPFSNDQFAWGQRVFELGVGAPPIPRKKLTAEKLARAIEFALGENLKNAAGELGVKIRSENGAQAAAEVVLDCLAQANAGETR
jgi:sterol 3beta-glucosyltransferase